MYKKLLAGVLALALLALSGCAAPKPGGAEYPLYEPETKGPGMTAYCKAIVDFLGCDYEYFEFMMGDEIYTRYTQLAAQGREEGFTPLIVIPTDTLAETFDVEFLDEVYGTGTTPEALAAWREQAIAEAAQTDAGALLQEIQRVYQQSFAEFGLDYEELELGSFVPALPNREAPLRGWKTPVEEAVIVKIPTRNPWELAIWAPMGGFNECPGPEEQAAVFRYWYEQYGAVPALLMGHDTWELQLDRPPQSDRDCENLAKEHLNFCPDVSPPLGNTVREIASHLRGSTVWQFWWD